MSLPKDLLAARDVLERELAALWPEPRGAVLADVAAPPRRPRVAIVLGSGLGGVVTEAEAAASVDYAGLPGLGAADVKGHASRWIIARIAGALVHVLAGRRHVYEGEGLAPTVQAVRLAALLGVRLLLVTNASGGLARTIATGDLVLLRDHVNLMFRSPLIGANLDELGPRFPDMSEPYSPAARAMLRRAALKEGIDLKEGVYAAVAGPNYETRAEVEALRRLGADVVGMSTVPEVLAARHAGLLVAAVSLVTNSHVNRPRRGDAKTDHEEVLAAGREGGRRLARLVRRALPALAQLAGAPAGRGEV